MKYICHRNEEAIKFQSLFYWILFFYDLIHEEMDEDQFCFNPYSTGFSSFIESQGVYRPSSS